jgi:FtsZ-interacting cell division protein YlmF
LSTIAQRLREKKKRLLNLRESRRRRSVRWLDFVSFRKRQPTDRLRLTL